MDKNPFLERYLDALKVELTLHERILELLESEQMRPFYTGEDGELIYASDLETARTSIGSIKQRIALTEDVLCARTL
ncbi:MAG: hypothetical protein AAGD43_03380 [Pseudomonadota bacterium]